MKRCKWANNEINIKYHDEIWGKEEHDDQKLFKMLILEGLQAGLSWEIILRKEEIYEQSLDHFDYYKISRYDEEKYLSLMNTPGLIHNQLKMKAIITNAQSYIRIIEEYGSFNNYIWRYVNYKPIIHHGSIPTYDELSTLISHDLKKRGFKFVGPTIIYSYMQAIGMYNDHEDDCDFKYL